jgi:hypothetical protein
VTIQAAPWHWTTGRAHNPRRCALCLLERLAVRLGLARHEEDRALTAAELAEVGWIALGTAVHTPTGSGWVVEKVLSDGTSLTAGSTFPIWCAVGAVDSRYLVQPARPEGGEPRWWARDQVTVAVAQFADAGGSGRA